MAQELYTKQIADALEEKDFERLEYWMEKRGKRADNISWGEPESFPVLAFPINFHMEDVAWELLDRRESIEKGTMDGYLALAAAGRWKKVELVKRLLEMGAEPNFEGDTEAIPLFETIFWVPKPDTNRAKTVEIFQLLLKHGANPNAIGTAGLPVYFRAAHDLELMKLLVEAGADLNARSTQRTIWTGGNLGILHYTAHQGTTEVAAFLIEKGVPVDLQDDCGWTALHYATFQVNRDLIALLKSVGANTELQTTAPLEILTGFAPPYSPIPVGLTPEMLRQHLNPAAGK